MNPDAWINVKTAAGMVGISARQFRDEWIPEDGAPQVLFRNTNGKTGRGRRPEVLLADLTVVLEARITQRAG